MKTLLSLLTLAILGTAAIADIQNPPAAEQTPIRKLGRGLSNILYGISEMPYTICSVNDDLGNNAAFSYGVVKGLHRSVYRFGMGWYEVVTFPIPHYKHSYRQPYPSNIPWIHNGYTEFPPELGNESRLDYVREYSGDN
ncbi:MAG: exosortase system-associated protein, TIGR04073 family [Verrucomicrobiota bacterium]